MEEEPVSVPEDFEALAEARLEADKQEREQPVVKGKPAGDPLDDDDFSLDGITAKPREKTREEIIAEAEAAAFAEAEAK